MISKKKMIRTKQEQCHENGIEFVMNTKKYASIHGQPNLDKKATVNAKDPAAAIHLYCLALGFCVLRNIFFICVQCSLNK